ncbi:MAG: tetratricopeptide repeat protein [bacterium]
MFSRNLRFILTILCFLLGIWNFSTQHLTLGLIALAAAVFLIYGHFRYGAVWLATRQVKLGRLPRAKKLLDETPNPRWLGKPQRSQYYFAKGLIASRESKPDDAEENFLRALEIGMRTPKDTAIVHLHLASNCLEKGNRDKARQHLETAIQLPLNPALSPWVAALRAKTNADKST